MNQTADSLMQQAALLHRQGRRPEAIAAYRELLAAKPELTDCWYNLGYLLRVESQYDAALEAYGQAIARGVSGAAEVHLNRAVIYSDHLRRDAEAERELRAALRLDPNYIPALLNLGNLHEERADREQAIACYRRILACPTASNDPHFGLRCEALARMVQLNPPNSADDPLLQQLARAAKGGIGVDHTVQANLQFALGRSYDQLGLHDQAFAAFVHGNRAARQNGRRYDRHAAEREMDALIERFASAGQQSPHDDTAPAPVFICGMFRSGSTLVEQVLAAHPKVTPGGELSFLRRLIGGPLAPFPTSMDNQPPERFAALAANYRAHLDQLFPGWQTDGGRVTDKRPDNFMLIGLIKRLFPSAKIIHTVRNPLDNGLAVFMQHLDQRALSYSSDLGDIGHFYGQYRRLMAHWRTLYGDSILDFDYDAFVRDPAPALAPLFEFLDLQPDPRCLEFHRLDNTVKTASYWQVRKPLYREASGRWRRYDQHLMPLKQALINSGAWLPA